MNRAAIFVDAGYLYAGGSALISETGQRLRRELIQTNYYELADRFSAYCQERTSGCRLLRIYWYDGAFNPYDPTSEQIAVGLVDDFKLRLGSMNSSQQQKGVDSLVVTDLVELARTGAISDAIVVSGDEDVRVGVEIAQKFGVKVHLLGIGADAYHTNQARTLQLEADTNSFWNAEDIAGFMSYSTSDELAKKASTKTSIDVSFSDNEYIPSNDIERFISEVVEGYVSTLDVEDIHVIVAAIDPNDPIPKVPPSYDRPILAQCSDRLGRSIDFNEKVFMRSAALRLAKSIFNGSKQ